MDEVAQTRKPVVITKRGQAVAQLIPVPAESDTLFGYMKGTVRFEGDVIAPLDEELSVHSGDEDYLYRSPGTAQLRRAAAPCRAQGQDQVRGVLLDTHVWLWYAEGLLDKLSAQAVKALDQARRGPGLSVSAISIWEIGMLQQKGRIRLSTHQANGSNVHWMRPVSDVYPWTQLPHWKAPCCLASRLAIRPIDF